MATDNHLHLAADRIIAEFYEATLAPEITQILDPEGALDTPNSGDWIRINSPSWVSGDRDASGLYEVNSAFMVIQMFTPKGQGITRALSVGSQIKDIYTGGMFDDMVIESVSVSPTPEPKGSPWFGVNVRINFTYEGFTSRS